MSDQPRIISRRELLLTAGAIGAAAVTSDCAAPRAGRETHSGVATAAPGAQPGQAREPYESLTAREADMLEAIVARLIPSDENGPGATEARAVRYIDRALGGALAGSLNAYRTGLSAFDGYCRLSRGKPFVELSRADQDAVLIAVETGAATTVGAGFTGTAAAFFTMVKNHTWQGTFGDPYYGGNANFVGWDLVGYPGIRSMVTAADQKNLEQNQLPANRRSAYDSDAFNKAIARAAAHGGPTHGD